VKELKETGSVEENDPYAPLFTGAWFVDGSGTVNNKSRETFICKEMRDSY